MKNKLKLAALSLCLAAGTANATGIPTVDIAASLQRAMYWTQQYNQMIQQVQGIKGNFNELKNMNAAQLGSRGLGFIYNNVEALPTYSQNLDDAFSDVKNSSNYRAIRATYPTSADPTTDSYYDAVSQRAAMSKEFYKKSQERLDQVNHLMTSVNNAVDPAAKADLANRLAIEQASISASNQTFKTMQTSMDLEVHQKAKARARAMLCAQLDGGC